MEALSRRIEEVVEFLKFAGIEKAIKLQLVFQTTQSVYWILECNFRK